MNVDYVINPSYPCSCTIEINGKALSIKYCSVHAAAPDLLAVCLRIRAELDRDAITGSGRRVTHEANDKVRFAINKAGVP